MTNPSDELEVDGNIKLSGSLFTNSIELTQGELGYLDGVTSSIQTQIDTKAPINSPNFNGNVGIGVTNPETALDIRSSSGLRLTNTETKVNVNDRIGYIDFNNSGFGAAIESCVNVGGANNNADLRFMTTLDYANSYIERMRIDRSGNVGIGTTSPTALLEIHKIYSTTDSLAPAGSLKFSTNNSLGNIWDLAEIESYVNAGPDNDSQNFPGGLAFKTSLPNGGLTRQMVIDANGNVGIGTTAPASVTKLHVEGDMYVKNGSLHLSTSGAIDTYPSMKDLCQKIEGTDGYFLDYYAGDANEYNGLGGHRFFQSHNGNKGQWVQALTIDLNSHVGIGTTAPNYGLERKGGTDNQAFHGDFYYGNNGGYGWKWFYTSQSGGGGNYNYNGSYQWFIYNLQSQSTTIYKEIGYFDGNTDVGNIDFTGQHRCFVDNIKHNQAVNYRGLIVCADKNEYISIESKPERGNKGIMINESLPLVSLSKKYKDKSCFGVISDSEDPETRSHSNGSILTSIFDKEIGDTRIYINSVGEGAIWIIDAGGNLESGDYITTSSVPGYGVVQESEFLANYTVAKITMDCNFNPALQPVKIIKKKKLLDGSGNQVYEGSGSITVEKNPDGFQVVFDISSGSILARKEKDENIFYEMSDGSYTTDTSGNKIKIYTVSGTTIIDNLDNVVYDYNGGDAKLTNDLDSNGDFQWEDTTEQEYAYNIRYVNATGTILTESEYTTKKAAGEIVFKAAFVGCTYHCG